MTKYEGYSEREDIQNLGTSQLMDRHRNELKNQDAQIGELIGVTKQGNKLAANLQDELEVQNVKLEKLDTEIEKTENKMSKTRAKFDEFVEKSNFCCLYILILLEIVAFFMVIFFIP